MRGRHRRGLDARPRRHRRGVRRRRRARWCCATRTIRSAWFRMPRRSPHSPTLAARHDATIVADEVHGPLAQPATPYTPFLYGLRRRREHGLAVTSASKAFNITGLKSRPDRLGERTRRSRARGAALRGRVAHGPVRGDRIDRRVPRGGPGSTACWPASTTTGDCSPTSSTTSCPACGIACPTPPTWPGSTCSALGWGDDPAAYALEHARVALAIGHQFGSEVGRGHARLNFACTPEVLAEA